VLAGFVAVMLGMQLARFGGVMRGVMMMPVRHLGVMGGHHMIFVVMMFGGLVVMLGGLLVMLSSLAMMLGDFGFGHGGILHGADAPSVTRSIRMSGDSSVPVR